MSYQQVLKGQTLGPGATFPDYCYFENCTINATCTFGVGCHFVGCTFKRCCPKPNTNKPSEIKSGIVVNSTLESVSLDNNTLGHHNTSTGYMVTDMSYKRSGVTHGEGLSSEKMDCCTGVSISPTDVGPVAQCEQDICRTPRGIYNETGG